jgi:hypothetical protein
MRSVRWSSTSCPFPGGQIAASVYTDCSTDILVAGRELKNDRYLIVCPTDITTRAQEINYRQVVSRPCCRAGAAGGRICPVAGGLGPGRAIEVQVMSVASGRTRQRGYERSVGSFQVPPVGAFGRVDFETV